MKGEHIKSGRKTVETDEAAYEISYSIKFVDGQFRCVARLRYDGQSWRHDPIHTKKQITRSEDNVEQVFQEVIESCRNAIESMESARELDLSVTVK